MKNKFFIIASIVIFIILLCVALYLLYDLKLSGSEFVTFAISFAVVGLIVAFSPEVREFTIAGNVVKLREIKNEAEKAIDELKIARTETFRFLLTLAKRSPGGFSSGGPIDDRVKDFWILYNNIVNLKCDKELRSDILDVVNTILIGQRYSVAHFSDKVALNYNHTNVIPSPKELENIAFDEQSIDIKVRRNVKGDSEEDIRKRLKSAIDEYRELYKLKEKLIGKKQ